MLTFNHPNFRLEETVIKYSGTGVLGDREDLPGQVKPHYSRRVFGDDILNQLGEGGGRHRDLDNIDSAIKRAVISTCPPPTGTRRDYGVVKGEAGFTDGSPCPGARCDKRTLSLSGVFDEKSYDNNSDHNRNHGKAYVDGL